MNHRITGSVYVLAAILGVSCIDMSAPKGPFSISVLQLPSPSVVVGDVMRDSNGVPAPLSIIAYDVNGTSLGGVTPQFFITDSAGVAHLDASHNLIGDRIGVVHLLGQIGSLQTAVATVAVTSAPFKFTKTTGADTAVAPLGGDSASSIGSAAIGVSLKSRGDSGSQGFIVRYVLKSAPASASASTGPAVYLANSDGKLSSVDTTDASGTANHRLVVNSRALADPQLVAGTKLDSALVVASTSYKGAFVGTPLTFVIYIRVTLGK